MIRSSPAERSLHTREIAGAAPASPTIRRERPILFSGPMVRAILDGRKSQTRRVLKNQATWDRVGDALLKRFPQQKEGVPYALGDRLWVRESVLRFDKGTCDQHIWYRAGRNLEEFSHCGPAAAMIGQAEGEWTLPEGPAGGAPYSVPSIFMPRWASRITLVVTDVRVQRVQDISEDDAKTEGCSPTTCANVLAPKEGFPSYRSDFAMLWDSLNAKRGFGWEANPWVVAVTFRRDARPPSETDQ